MSLPTIVFGGAAWLSTPGPEVSSWLTVLHDLKIRIIDTAEIYGTSESAIGDANAALNGFVIDTKHPGGFATEESTKETVIQHCKDSLKKLKTDSVDIYYIHAPDRRVPIKTYLEGLTELHKAGSFKRLGISNFSPSEIDEIFAVAKEHNLLAPSVYQGNYSAVARRADSEIFPLVRKYGMAFYAYSPIAGGFLSKSKAQLTDPQGRFGEGQPLAKVYNGMYNRPSFVAALDEWEKIAEAEGVSRAELAYRWVAYHSMMSADKGDAIIVGARNVDQLKETVAALKAGPLSDGAVKRIDEVWDSVKHEASLDNYEMLTSK